MLTKADDFPIHQTPEPIAYTGTDRNFYDRYFFNGYHASEDIFFACAMGQYPALNVTDAAFSLVHEGKQTSVFASRVLGHERMDTTVAPIAVDVLEPLVSHRIRVNANESGIEADLIFRKRTIAVEEPRFTYRLGTRTILDYTRLTQFGDWQGWISLGGKHIEVTPQHYRGVRDRSWGIRPVGASDSQPPAPPPEPQFYWLWAPLNFDDGATLFHVNENAEGAIWARSAQWVPLDPGSPREMADGRAQLNFQSGTRHAKNAELFFFDAGGETTIRLTPRFKFFMRGVGYMHPTRGHGTYHGDHSVCAEVLDLATIDEAEMPSTHIQAIVDAEMSGPLCADGGNRKGRGLLEQMIIGRHEPSGFADLFALAP